MKITNIKRISKDDFNDEDQELIGRLAFALNPFLEQISSAFNKNIDFDNLNQEIITFETEVDANGRPKINSEIKTNIKTRVRGIYCVDAANLTDGTFPTGTPFISRSITGNIITITNISSLPPNKRFRLSIILIG